MKDEKFRRVFSRGMSLNDAWRACGVQLPNLRNAPWHAYRPDATLLLTVWRDHPDAGRWIRWGRGNFSARTQLRVAVEERLAKEPQDRWTEYAREKWEGSYARSKSR